MNRYSNAMRLAEEDADDLTVYRGCSSCHADGILEAREAASGYMASDAESDQEVIFMLHPEHSPIIVTDRQFYDHLGTMGRRIVNWPVPGTDCCLTFDKAATFPMGDKSVLVGPCFITSPHAARTGPDLIDAVTGLLEIADRWTVFCDGKRDFHGFIVDRVPDKAWWEEEAVYDFRR